METGALEIENDGCVGLIMDARSEVDDLAQKFAGLLGDSLVTQRLNRISEMLRRAILAYEWGDEEHGEHI